MKYRNAFTLVELMIVIIILGVLAAIVIAPFANVWDDAKVASVQTTVDSVRRQVELYKLQTGGLPPAADGFWATLGSATVIDGKTVGPWIQSPPVNPFNQSTAVGSGTASATNGWAMSNGKFYGNARGVWVPAD